LLLTKQCIFPNSANNKLKDCTCLFSY